MKIKELKRMIKDAFIAENYNDDAAPKIADDYDFLDEVESNEIVAGVKKNGVPVEYVVYPDEGHGFVKKENQITTTKTTLAFLEKYLKTKK